jgi:hypothetical protein
MDVYSHLIPGGNVACIDNTLDSAPRKMAARRKQAANAE